VQSKASDLFCRRCTTAVVILDDCRCLYLGPDLALPSHACSIDMITPSLLSFQAAG
jgi:hypothetical protein